MPKLEDIPIFRPQAFDPREQNSDDFSDTINFVENPNIYAFARQSLAIQNVISSNAWMNPYSLKQDPTILLKLDTLLTKILPDMWKDEFSEDGFSSENSNGEPTAYIKKRQELITKLYNNKYFLQAKAEQLGLDSNLPIDWLRELLSPKLD